MAGTPTVFTSLHPQNDLPSLYIYLCVYVYMNIFVLHLIARCVQIISASAQYQFPGPSNQKQFLFP